MLDISFRMNVGLMGQIMAVSPYFVSSAALNKAHNSWRATGNEIYFQVSRALDIHVVQYI